MRGLWQLMGELREALGGGSFMGGGFAYSGPEPGKIFSLDVTFKNKDPLAPVGIPRRHGVEREENPREVRRLRRAARARQRVALAKVNSRVNDDG